MPGPNDQQDEIQNNEPESRRDTLLAGLEALENPAPDAGDTGETVVLSAEDMAAARARDQQGRFAPKPADAPAPAAAAPTPAAEPAPSLTTWRKEYLPIQQKLAAGLPLTADEATKLAAYNVQREKEYSTGVSTYRAEALQAKQFTDAMAEFIPTLQQHNIQPAQWIQNLGRAHQTLAMGSPEQKLQMFARLAQDYGVPMAAIQQQQQGQMDPVTLQLMAEVDRLNKSVTGVTSWREQQEVQAIQQELSKFLDTAQYPHFEQVREPMIQLLESGMAQNPDAAYKMAVRLDESLSSADQARQAQATAAATEAARQAAIKKAKNAGASVRTATPSGAASSPSAKDRRGALAASFEAVDAGRV